METKKTANSITIEFTSEEMAYLADSLIDPIGHSEAVALEKVANCRSRMFSLWLPKLRERGATIPADDGELVALILGQEDYKTRAQGEVGLE